MSTTKGKANKAKIITAADSSDEEIIEAKRPTKRRVELAGSEDEPKVETKKRDEATEKVKAETKKRGETTEKVKADSKTETKKRGEVKADPKAETKKRGEATEKIKADPKAETTKTIKSDPKATTKSKSAGNKLDKPNRPQTPQELAEDIKNRVLKYLEDRDEAVPTIEIAQHIYGKGATRKMINKELYELARKNLISKESEENGTKPRWAIA